MFAIRQRFFFILFLLSAFLFGCFALILDHHTIDFSSLQQDVQAKPTVLLDVSGKIWGQFRLDKRQFILLESIPDHLIQAFLITEDRSFFNHPGISFRGIIRSMLVNICSGKKMQGASTITQQLVRLLFLDNKKTMLRKVKEQLYALLLERQWSKEQILESYLNNVYFGAGIYGVQAAAQRFWGLDIQDVSIDQAAVLASIMKSPYHYSPMHKKTNVVARRNLILKMMVDAHMIDQQVYQEAIDKPLMIKEIESNVVAPHLKEALRIQLESMVGRLNLYTQGFVIQTTIDVSMQQAAEKSFKDHVKYLRQKFHDQVDGGMIVLDSASGHIRAMVGGYDFKSSKVNRALYARKQMGSIFKILLFAQALKQGLKLSDVEVDEPFQLVSQGGLWAPKNYNDQFLGDMTRAYALSHSNNIVAIKTLLQIGADNVIQLAKACHITAPMKPYPSLALGCVDVTLAQTAGAFNVIVNNGIYVAPEYLLWVKNNVGEKIYQANSQPEIVLDSIITSQIAHVLSFAIKRLSYFYQQKLLPFPAIGKTGTTNDSRICWFCGATPSLTSAIYIGCDYNQSLGKNVFGSKTAFPIWYNFQTAIENDDKQFYIDPALHKKTINWRTGLSSKNKESVDIVTLLEA